MLALHSIRSLLSFVNPAIALTIGALACGVEQGESDVTASSDAIVKERQIPAELTAMIGRYEGASTSYRWDGTKMVPASSWTEVVVTKTAVLDATTAHVTAEDKMTFDGSFSMDISWTEGFLRKRDGSLGTRYFDVQGVRVLEIEVAPHVWSMKKDNSVEDLKRFGFGHPVRGFTITTKTVAVEDGVETDRLTAVSDIVWRDEASAEHRGHYVTMTGYHKRR